MDNPSNDRMTNLILSGLYSLTRKNMIIPYKIDDENGLVSSIDCNENSQSVYRDDEYESSPFSLFLEVNPTEKNN